MASERLERRRACAKKVRLVAEYGAAVAAYYAAAGELESAMIIGSTKAFHDRYQATEEARAACDAARIVLEKHVASHKC